METGKFKVHFNWKDKFNGNFVNSKAFKKKESIFNNYFVGIYNRGCELLNDRYAEWNEEFDKMYPEEMNKDASLEDSKYPDYIRARQNAALGIIHDPIFKLFSGDDCDIRGEMKRYPGVTVSITLEPVK